MHFDCTYRMRSASFAFRFLLFDFLSVIDSTILPTILYTFFALLHGSSPPSLPLDRPSCFQRPPGEKTTPWVLPRLIRHGDRPLHLLGRSRTRSIVAQVHVLMGRRRLCPTTLAVASRASSFMQCAAPRHLWTGKVPRLVIYSGTYLGSYLIVH